MDDFLYLIDKCVGFKLSFLKDIEQKSLDALQENAMTYDVKILQAMNMDRAIFIVGVFSMYESTLQNKLNCRNGFKEIEKILKQNNKQLLLNQFLDLKYAINALKHGEGISHNTLLKKENLKIKIKKSHSEVFQEGNITEIETLILVNDKFILDCVKIMHAISKVLGDKM